MDFTLSRKKLTDGVGLFGHNSLRECIAYHCQFSYLTEYGTKTMRAGALAAFANTYLAILVFRYCTDHNASLHQPSTEEFFRDPRFIPLINAYSNADDEMAVKAFLAERIEKLRTDHPNIDSLVFSVLGPGLGIPLALMVRNEKFKILKTIARQKMKAFIGE